MGRDPVCGMNVDPEKPGAKINQGGKSFYFCCSGCARKFEESPEKYLGAAQGATKSTSDVTPIAAARPAVASLPILHAAHRVKDPVCGMMVDPQKAVGKVEYSGKAYHFCSIHCAERFSKEPEKFLVEPGTGGMEREPTGNVVSENAEESNC